MQHRESRWEWCGDPTARLRSDMSQSGNAAWTLIE
jgi:hypothetical protein